MSGACSSTTAIARRGWLCCSCGRQWDRAWTLKDSVRDVPRVFRDTWRAEPWFIGVFSVACVAVAAPLFLLLEAIGLDGLSRLRCPICEGRLINQGDGKGHLDA